jgi:hypothetical protein
MKLPGLIVGGLLLAAAVVAAAQASNDWLNRRGVATGPGFTVEERKAHAHQNQLEWDRRFQHDE